MLRKITLSNFKCFRSLVLDCQPLTLLCGVNGIGKSSLIQALLVLRQSFESGDLLRGKLDLGGGLADLGTGRDVLFEGADNDNVSFALECDQIPNPWVRSFEYAETADQLMADVGSRARHSDFVPEEWCQVPPFAKTLLYVDAERVGPRKSYPLSESLASRGDFGTSSEYALNFLNLHQNDRLPVEDPRCLYRRSHRLIEVVNLWLQEVTPGARLQFETIQAADALIAGFSFERPGDVPTRRYRATNVGFGLSYTLPVLLALLSNVGTLCLIENPEAHLHPRGQTVLAELAARASLAGVQVIVETHSDHFMDGVRIAVRDRLVSPDAVGFHYFERVDGATVVSSPRVDADGRLSTWPPGFFDQHEENLAKLLAPRA